MQEDSVIRAEKGREITAQNVVGLGGSADAGRGYPFCAGIYLVGKGRWGGSVSERSRTLRTINLR